MGLLVVAALLGLLGLGSLSWAAATSGDGLVEVEYQRFGHLEADDMVTIGLAPAAVTGDSVEVSSRTTGCGRWASAASHRSRRSRWHRLRAATHRGR